MRDECDCWERHPIIQCAVCGAYILIPVNRIDRTYLYRWISGHVNCKRTQYDPMEWVTKVKVTQW